VSSDAVVLVKMLISRTWDSRDKMAQMVLDNMLACLKGDKLPNIVPEHK